MENLVYVVQERAECIEPLAYLYATDLAAVGVAAAVAPNLVEMDQFHINYFDIFLSRAAVEADKRPD